MAKEIEEHEDINLHMKKRTLKKIILYLPYFGSILCLFVFMVKAYPQSIGNSFYDVLVGISFTILLIFNMFKKFFED